MSRPTRVAILVVTYDSAEEIAACLDSALAQEAEDLGLEVVVVDNASGDHTLEVLRGYGDRIRVIALDENRGYAEGVNTAFTAAEGDWVLLLNPDTVMYAGCIAALVDHLEHNPRAASAAALLRDPGGDLQRFARRDLFKLADVAWNFTQLGRRLDERRGGRALDWRRYEDEWRAGPSVPFSVDCPAAACVLVRRALLAPRPFDPALPLFFNDAELWRRLRRKGWSHDVVPTAAAVHGAGTSVRRVDRPRMRAEWVASTRRYLAPELRVPGRAALYALFLADALTSALLHKLGRGRPETPAEVRGTLGGLGLPGGAPPWLAPVRRPYPAGAIRRLRRRGGPRARAAR